MNAPASPRSLAPLALQVNFISSVPRAGCTLLPSNASPVGSNAAAKAPQPDNCSPRDLLSPGFERISRRPADASASTRGCKNCFARSITYGGHGCKCLPRGAKPSIWADNAAALSSLVGDPAEKSLSWLAEKFFSGTEGKRGQVSADHYRAEVIYDGMPTGSGTGACLSAGISR